MSGGLGWSVIYRRRRSPICLAWIEYMSAGSSERSPIRPSTFWRRSRLSWGSKPESFLQCLHEVTARRSPYLEAVALADKRLRLPLIIQRSHGGLTCVTCCCWDFLAALPTERCKGAAFRYEIDSNRIVPISNVESA